MAKRAFITPDFFSVARELIGLPLASPSRRAFAMMIDGILVGILVQAGGVFLGLAAVFLLWRASGQGPRGGFFRESVRLWLRATAALILFIIVIATWNFGERKIKSAEQAFVAAVSEDEDENDDEARITEADTAARDTPVTDSTAIALLTDSATATDSLRVQLASLQQRSTRLENERNRLRADLARARERRGLRSLIGGLFDDLGLGFGWAAVYFTGFLAMMRGQTPGKRLLGIRVIRLDGKPLGWWMSFERFGGYAASFSVGLLGFGQILWDRNRQGLHDKVCETVVVLDNRQAAARS